MDSRASESAEDSDERSRLREKIFQSDSPYKAKIVEEVQKKLQKASDTNQSGESRLEILRQLFTDVVLEIDNRAQGLLCGETEQLEPPSHSGGKKSQVCFFEILSEHYAEFPADGDSLVDLFHPLWSMPLTSHLFALLLYKWLFKSTASHGDEIRRLSRGFINGLGNIFWIDLQSNSKRFLTIFDFAAYEVLLNMKNLTRLSNNAHRDLAQIICAFFFFYKQKVLFPSFMSRLSLSMGPNFGSGDFFVAELTNQLHKIKVEPVLIQYLESTKAIKGIDMRATTSIRLQVVLYSLNCSGGPFYPTKEVRKYAKDSLDHVFPLGRHSRTAVRYLLRLLLPICWPGSCWSLLKIVGRRCRELLLGAMQRQRLKAS